MKETWNITGNVNGTGWEIKIKIKQNSCEGDDPPVTNKNKLN